MAAVCRNCGHVGESERKLKGSVIITLILLCAYILPGIIYMVWRRTGLKDRCAKCGSEQVVPQGSPRAAALMQGVVSPETHVKCPDCRELVLRDARKCKHCGIALVPQ